MKLCIGSTVFLVLVSIFTHFNTVKGSPDETLRKLRIAPVKPSGKAIAANVGNIFSHGGPVMMNPTIYVVWYGNWAGNMAVSIIETFLRGLGTSSWWGMTKAYNNTANIVFGSSTTDSYSEGTSLTESKVLAIINNAIRLRKLPSRKNGIYLVLTSADVNEDGFCTQYCGYHSYSGTRKYSFVGNPARCPYSCTAQPTKSPNNNVGADGMISVIAHELTETVTDPLLNAWYDSSGYENADKCSWTFGTQYLASNGAYYNMELNGKQYLVQQNWKYPAQTCGMY